MGGAGIRRSRAVREAAAGRLPGRPLLDHDPAQARELPPRLRWLRAQEDRPLHAGEARTADAGRRHRPQPPEDRGRRALGARLSRDHGQGTRLLAPVVGLPRRRAENKCLPQHQAGPGRDPVVAPNLQGAGAARLQVLRTDHRVCVHAGGRHGQRPSGDLSPPRGHREAPRPAMNAKRASRAAARAWQRMLSGRRLDLLDPSPLDIEVADIAHGLARVARWNGQTEGPNIYSVAQHSLLVETIARQRARLSRPHRLAALLHDAPEYVIGDMISPFKAVIGDAYKTVEARLMAAIHLRFGLPAVLPADLLALIKASDRAAAYLEATRLAGFAKAEAVRFFGSPPALSVALERDYLTPWPTEVAQARYLERFSRLVGD